MEAELLPPARPVGRPRTRTERPAEYDSPEAVQARKEYMAAYKLANKERLLNYYRTWKETHREEARASNRAYMARVRQARRLAVEAPEVPASEAPEN